MPRQVLFPLLVCAIILNLTSCSKERKSNKAASKMKDFIIEISNYSRSLDSGFIVIPQNGIELCFKNEDLNDGFETGYLNAIDGIGVEELFYDGEAVSGNERLDMARLIKSSRQVLVADHANNNDLVNNAYQKNTTEGFIAFPRTKDNYDYLSIPDSVFNENNHDIESLKNAQNYLYLISSSSYPKKDSFLAAIASTNFDLVLIDLFYEENPFTKDEIEKLKLKKNGGKRLVIAYMNIGAAESYRFYWKENWKLHKPGWLKKNYEGYSEEIWVKFWKKEWQDIIYGNNESYVKKIIDAGFDGTYLDNIEAYYFLYFD